jgi:hypothetical protein
LFNEIKERKVMAEQDGKPVTPEVSTGTPAPVVEATPDPIEAKIAAAVQEALTKQQAEQSRKIQSEVDKRVGPLQRRLTDAERRAQVLEGTLATMPHSLGPDADPAVVARLQNQSLQANLGFYRQRDQADEAARREQEAKDAVFQATRNEVAELGLEPDDPRIVYDLDQPDAEGFRRKVMASVRSALKEDNTKELDSRTSKMAADIEAKLRKATGVDSHDTGGTVGTQTFTKAQISNREFYKANKEAIQKARAEGRIKE